MTATLYQRLGEAKGIARIVEARCLEQGLIVRAIGDVIAVSPPLIISPSELDLLIERLLRGIADAQGDLLRRGITKAA